MRVRGLQYDVIFDCNVYAVNLSKYRSIFRIGFIYRYLT